MNEEEWVMSADPDSMLEFLRGKGKERKLRLFLCSCCRRQRHTPLPKELAAVTVAEALADGETDETARVDSEQFIRSLLPEHGGWSTYTLFAWSLNTSSSSPLDTVLTWLIPGAIEARLICSDDVKSILHDIFGDCLHSITINPAWHTSTVLALATGIYQEKAFHRMPILADALQDAGCDNEDILYHCRQPGEHVRGCWLIDLLTGRE